MTGLEKKCDWCGANYNCADVDPCLGYLPGVVFACCGHTEGNSYIVFENGVVVRHFDRIEYDGPLSDEQITSYAEMRAKHRQTVERSYTRPSVILEYPQDSSEFFPIVPTNKPHDPTRLDLTRKQWEVFRLLAQGMSNKTIAYELGNTEGTVKAHISVITKKWKALSKAKYSPNRVTLSMVYLWHLTKQGRADFLAKVRYPGCVPRDTMQGDATDANRDAAE